MMKIDEIFLLELNLSHVSPSGPAKEQNCFEIDNENFRSPQSVEFGAHFSPLLTPDTQSMDKSSAWMKEKRQKCLSTSQDDDDEEKNKKTTRRRRRQRRRKKRRKENFPTKKKGEERTVFCVSSSLSKPARMGKG
jgi:hypothetical protein